MALPNVNIKLGNGNLGRVASTTDGVAGLLLTGDSVVGKLELSKHYLLSSTADLANLGVTAENNFLIDKEVKAFYAQAGEGAELHLFVVAAATTLTAMCAADAASPLNKLIHASGGRVRLVGINKRPTTPVAAGNQGIDADAVTAGAAAQAVAESQTKSVRPFRVLLPACGFKGTTDSLYKPSSSSYNRVGYVMASDEKPTEINKGKTSAAVGQILGRAAKIAVHRSIGRVKDGAIAAEGWLTDGTKYEDAQGLSESLNDAGYIFYLKYPTKNGCYLNGDPMAASVTDDYSELHLGRVIDKAYTIVYDTYISEIMDNITVDKDGKIPSGVCLYYQGLIDNAIGVAMGDEISAFESFVDPAQNVLSSGVINIEGKIVPQGVIKAINFGLSFDNPAK